MTLIRVQSVSIAIYFRITKIYNHIFILCYFLPGTKQITIDTNTGELKVAALNRDVLKQEVFNFIVSL